MQPNAQRTHWVSLCLCSLLLASMVINSILPAGHLKAALNTKTWTTSGDFASGINSNIDTPNNEAKLASTTANFTEDFSSTTNKGAGTTANWDTAGNKLTLTGDPANGITTNLVSEWTTAIGSAQAVASILTDPETGFVYLGGANGSFAYYDQTTNSITKLTAKISLNWGSSTIYNMVYDSKYKYIYMVGGTKKLGAFKGGADPANGTFVYLSSLLPGSATATEAIGYDSINNYVYYTAQLSNSGVFPAIANPADLVAEDFIVLSGFAPGGMVRTMAFDPVNSIMYVGSGGGKALHCFNTSSTPSSGTWTSLAAKIVADFPNSGSGTVYVLVVDPVNHFLYIAGGASTYNRFGVITIVANPETNAVYTSLTSRLTSATRPSIMAMAYANGKLFLGYTQAFEMFSGGSNPATGTSTYFNTKLNGSWNSGDPVRSMAYSDVSATLYFGGSGGSNSIADLASYQIGYTNNLIGVSTKINATTSPIAKATLTATENLAAETSIIYSLSNDGGSTWNTVSPGVLFSFPTLSNNLMWKAALSTTNLSNAPTTTNIAVSYTYYNSLTGTMDLKFNADQSVAWTSLYWTGSTPTNTAMTFKIKTATSDVALGDANWSDIKNASDTPVNLKTLNVNGQPGVLDGQWVEIFITLSTTDGANTPILQDISADYVINSPPEIQSVTASQRTDGSKIVDIGYQLRDTDTATDEQNPGQVDISLKYSVDSGAHWSDCITATGTGLVGTATTFAPKTATWNVGADLANRFYDNTVMVQVVANDNELAHNLASADTLTFTIETKPPVLGLIGSNSGIQVGDGAAWVNSPSVNLTLLATDDSSKKMQIRNDTSFTSVENDFENYATNKNGWALSSADGNKAVNVRFKDSFGNTTDASANVLLDTTAPGVPNNVGIYDTSEPNLSRFALTLIWDKIPTVDDFSDYIIERSVDSGDYSELEITGLTVMTDQDLDQTKSYSYRVKSKDIHNNSSAYSEVVTLKPNSADTTPPSITSDLPTITASDKSATFSWATNEPSDSYVEFGTTESLGSVQGNDSMTKSHAVTLIGLSPNTSYFYKVRSKDATNNIGYSTSSPMPSFTTLADQDPVDRTAPVITSDVPTVEATFNGATVSWNTDENSNSYVEFGKTDQYGTTLGQDEITKAHTVTIPNLDSITIYHFKVKSTDDSGNQAASADSIFVTLANPNPPDIDPPQITGPNPSITSSSEEATVVWNTDENSDSFVEFGKTIEYGTIEGIDELKMEHSLTIKNLSPSTGYHLRVRSRDQSGNLKIGEDISFTTSVATGSDDSTPPKITGLSPSVSAKSNGAIIAWNTDEPADSFVEFGETVSYGFTEGKIELLSSHTIELIGLEPETAYHFRVRSADQNGNLAAGEDQTFTTSVSEQNSGKVTINGATAQKPGADPEEVTIIWTTDLYATSQVLFGTTESLDQSTLEDITLNKTHYVKLAKLKPNTKYFYQARSKNANDDVFLGEQKYFITSQTGLSTPSISGVEVTDITLNSAIVSWESTVVTTSVIKYGVDINYGSQIEDLSFGSTTQHVVRFKNLNSGIKYHFRVLGETSSGDTVSSDDYVFSTLTTPEISNIEVKDIASDKATITWKTNTETDSFVDFGGDAIDQSQGRSDLVLDHAITLIGLKAATKYSFKIKSRDKYTNQAVSDTQSFATIVDTIPPQIKDLRSETSIVTDPNGESKAQVIVSWSSDEPATSLVKYSMGAVVGNSYSNSTTEDSNLTTSHIVIISNLASSATYHLKIISSDASTNIGSSDDYTVLTQKQDTSLVQYIISILEDRFFWLKKYGLFN